MKIKKGFTLAEVLITLGIIGIISALTIPQLINKTQNSHLGAQISSAVSTLENAIGIFLYDNNVRNTTQLGSMTVANLLSVLAGNSYGTINSDKLQYVRMKTISSSDGFTSLKKTCSVATTSNSYYLPDKSIIGPCSSAALTVNTGTSNNEMFFLSSRSVNNKAVIEGHDFFRFSVSADGNIYIPGADYGSSTTSETCKLSGGYACIGVIAKNAWKANY